MSPHVVVLARLEKIERMVGEQPETMRGIFKEELERYVVNGFSMEQLWGMMREDADRGVQANGGAVAGAWDWAEGGGGGGGGSGGRSADGGVRWDEVSSRSAQADW